MPEYIFEISEKTQYWIDKNKRRLQDVDLYEKGVMRVMQERHPELAGFIEKRVELLGVEGPLLRFGAALAFDPVQRQFDRDRTNLEIDAGDIAAYERTLDESILVAPESNPQSYLVQLLANPQSVVDADWIIDKISRTGPRYKGVLQRSFGSAMQASAEIVGTPYFAQAVMDGMFHAYLPIARKLDGMAMARRFGV